MSRLVIFLHLVAFLLVSGCARPPGATTSTAGSKSRKHVAEDDPLQLAVESLRNAQTSAGYREALRQFDAYLQQPEVRTKVQLAAGERGLLEQRLHLDKDELAELQAGFFRPLDAYHVEECFLLRDAARALEQPGTDALKQAELCLEWTARQILLRERVDYLIPPLFVLQQGHGTATERALVFLGLLQQLQIQGCVLARSEKQGGLPEAIWVGVVAGAKDKQDIFLFDPRLGRPVPAADGKGIATLGEFRKQPKQSAPDRPQSAGRAAALLVTCPLSALAPRMRVLEKVLESQEKVILAAHPAEALKLAKNVSGEEVGFWNPPASKDRNTSNSPTRMLRSFLPQADGGMDDGARRARFESQHQNRVFGQFAAAGLLDEQVLPKAAQAQLMVFVGQLFRHFASEPRNLLLRGRYEKAAKRLDILTSVYDDLEFSPVEDSVFRKAVRAWCIEARQAYLAMARQEPDAKDKVDALWKRDQYLTVLLSGREKPDPGKQKTIVSILLLTALRDTLGEEAHYLQAETWQERAEMYEAAAQRLAGAGENVKFERAAENARQAWQNTAGLWRKCVERFALDLTRLPARLTSFQAVAERGPKAQMAALWNQFLHDVERSVSARLNLAHALERQGKTAEALVHVTEVAESLKTFQASPAVLAAKEAQNPSLSRDLGPAGGTNTELEIARRRLERLKKK